MLDQVIENRAGRRQKAVLTWKDGTGRRGLHDGDAVNGAFRGPRAHFVFQIGDDRLGRAVGEDLGLLAADCATDQHGLASAATEKCDDDKAHENQHRKGDDQCRPGWVADAVAGFMGVCFHGISHLTVYMRS